jgi:hypothetical protein
MPEMASTDKAASRTNRFNNLARRVEIMEA